MGVWDRCLWELGFAICHQRMDRLLLFGGRPLFVCARDTGLFVSFFGLLLALSFLRGEKRAGMPPPVVGLLCIAGVLFLAWEGLTGYLGWRESTNLLRFLSGAAGGAGLAVPLAALVNREVWGGDVSRRVMGKPSDFLSASAVLLAASVLYLLRPALLFRLAQLGLVVSILGAIWSLDLLLVCLLKPGRGNKQIKARTLTALFLLALELGASYGLHRLLAGGGPVVPAAGTLGWPF